LFGLTPQDSVELGRFVLRSRLLPGGLIWGSPPFLGTQNNLSESSWAKKEAQTIYRFGLPCTMFGFCDESPEANPYNPIFCGVFSPNPCCELRGGRMGQIAKTTVKSSGSS
jgi:hypothetical protein